MPKCNSCGTAIHWLKQQTDKREAKPNPIDVAPHWNGNLVLNVSQGLYRFATNVEIETAKAEGKHLYISHFSTCPNAKTHRRRKP